MMDGYVPCWLARQTSWQLIALPLPPAIKKYNQSVNRSLDANICGTAAQNGSCVTLMIDDLPRK
jgi:hypothetical protein